MAYRIELKRSALKELDKAPKAVAGRLWAAIDALAAEPRPDGARKVRGHERAYRIRVGDWRIIYEVHDDQLLVLVIRARHRKDVYRG